MSALKLPGTNYRLGSLRTFQPFHGTRVVVVEGCGRDGHHIVREVTYWYDENGALILRDDPYPENAAL